MYGGFFDLLIQNEDAKTDEIMEIQTGGRDPACPMGGGCVASALIEVTLQKGRLYRALNTET